MKATARKKHAAKPVNVPKTAPARAPDSGATPTAFWAGEFGAEYTERNQVDWSLRVPLLQRMIEQTGAETFLDIGCNAGWNLLALRKISPDYMMSGVDINHQALLQASAEGFDVINMPASAIADCDELGPDCAQMVITSGVLIHIPPSELEAVMRAIVTASSRYVLCIEYEHPVEQMVEYRGHQHRLWKRPFGELYERLGMSVVERGQAEGYVDCQYTLLEKES
jgi:spore coat polysaccharide biosynthesis protein SpsF